MAVCVVFEQVLNMALSVGELFNSFTELERRISQLEKDDNLSLWKRDSRTIEKARAKGLKRHVRPELQYYSLRYACYHGGRSFKSRSSGTRTNQRLVHERTNLCLSLAAVVGCGL